MDLRFPGIIFLGTGRDRLYTFGQELFGPTKDTTEVGPESGSGLGFAKQM
jgi:hypothetical protein